MTTSKHPPSRIDNYDRSNHRQRPTDHHRTNDYQKAPPATSTIDHHHQRQLTPPITITNDHCYQNLLPSLIANTTEQYFHRPPPPNNTIDRQTPSVSDPRSVGLVDHSWPLVCSCLLLIICRSVVGYLSVDSRFRPLSAVDSHSRSSFVRFRYRSSVCLALVVRTSLDCRCRSFVGGRLSVDRWSVVGRSIVRLLVSCQSVVGRLSVDQSVVRRRLSDVSRCSVVVRLSVDRCRPVLDRSIVGRSVVGRLSAGPLLVGCRSLFDRLRSLLAAVIRDQSLSAVTGLFRSLSVVVCSCSCRCFCNCCSRYSRCCACCCFCFCCYFCCC